ncbi:MAG: cytochrome c [Candidatus Thiodiazotropha sp. (ex Codakia rugifera)]|nr:cytochrome c [Candidatus Thiodiazotropha sp. (ex Codakia rugifera)]
MWSKQRPLADLPQANTKHTTRQSVPVQLTVALLVSFLALSQPAVANDETTIEQLPDSLGQWYKPVNKRQVWLHTMFALRREMQAVDEYAALRDLPRLKKWSDKFIQHFKQLPEMVPEWDDELELDEIARLDTEVNQGDFKAVSQTLARISRNCRACHRDYRALAAVRYRTADFSQVSISDNEQGEISYTDHMKALSRNINRIKIASEDSRWKSAQQAAEALEVQLELLGKSCDNCHKDQPPYERILGRTSQQMLDELAQAIHQHQPKLTARRLGETAVSICARCHSVHRSLSDIRHQLFP